MNSPNGIYATQRSRVWCRELDQDRFYLLNNEGHQALDNVGGYCIDAPEQIPAGSMRSYDGGYRDQTLAERYNEAWDMSVVERKRREELAERIIAEILAEEAAAAAKGDS